MVTSLMPIFMETRVRQRKMRDIGASLSRIDSNYFVHDLINLAKQDPDYADMLTSLNLRDEEILGYYSDIVINFPDSDMLWVNNHYLPACIIFHRSTLFYVHNAVRNGGDMRDIIRTCYRYFITRSRGAVRNIA